MKFWGGLFRQVLTGVTYRFLTEASVESPVYGQRTGWRIVQVCVCEWSTWWQSDEWMTFTCACCYFPQGSSTKNARHASASPPSKPFSNLLSLSLFRSQSISPPPLFHLSYCCVFCHESVGLIPLFHWSTKVLSSPSSKSGAILGVSPQDILLDRLYVFGPPHKPSYLKLPNNFCKLCVHLSRH